MFVLWVPCCLTRLCLLLLCFAEVPNEARRDGRAVDDPLVEVLREADGVVGVEVRQEVVFLL